jgi:hypothetical protein
VPVAKIVSDTKQEKDERRAEEADTAPRRTVKQVETRATKAKTVQQNRRQNQQDKPAQQSRQTQQNRQNQQNRTVAQNKPAQHKANVADVPVFKLQIFVSNHHFSIQCGNFSISLIRSCHLCKQPQNKNIEYGEKDTENKSYL